MGEGQYKTVNTVGAAVISAQINAANGEAFPYVFGGDGAAFAIAPQQRMGAEKALRAVKRWAHVEFGIELRVAIVSVEDVQAAGFEVNVAKLQVSDGASYAMFDGGGVSWAEHKMKRGYGCLDMAEEGVVPDLTGLSCRWTPMRTQKGSILSLIALPVADVDPPDFLDVVTRVIEVARVLDRGGHPIPESGPGFRWPPAGLSLEAHASHGNGSLFLRKLRLYAETFLAGIFFLTRWKVGGFDPMHYVRTTGVNADFRKFEDGLKMTLDCDEDTRVRLETLLDKAQTDGILDYGLFEQDEAILTCIVPSVMEDNHVHFVDGASGGYTSAAQVIKWRHNIDDSG